MRLLSALRDRWDLDPETQASLPFDRALALVNLRRVEVACLLAFTTNAIEVPLGFTFPAILVIVALAGPFAFASRRMLRWRSLRAQQAGVILFFVIGLADIIWAVAEISGRSAHISGGYLLNLLSLTMLFVLPPRTLAWIIVGMSLAYAAVVLRLPLPAGDRIAAVINAVIVSGIAQVAGWLIHSARRGDHEQKRIIRAQNARLSEQNHERDQLMAITAHDLRSPLYGVRDLLDLASRRADGDGASQVGPMRDAVFGLDSMIALVTRLLDAHSAEYEPLSAPLRADVRDQLAAAARRIAPASEAAAVTVLVETPETPLVAAFDEIALGRVLDNLLDNAVRVSPRGGRVRLRGIQQEQGALIEIEDQGPGFDAAGRAAMFGKFHQRGGGPSGAKAGTGMGLFIAATFAERMNAMLRFEPVEPSGARFLLALS